MEYKETIASALCKAQSEFTRAAQSGYNPHFKSTFSTIDDLIEATRPALTKYGLAVSQSPTILNGVQVLRTVIKNDDDEIESFTLICLKDPTNQQEFGKAVSYICRYVYKTILCVQASVEDDDGNESAHIQTNNVSSAYISEKQLSLLRMQLIGQPDREAKICAHYNIKSLDQLPWKYMNEVLEKLKGK